LIPVFKNEPFTDFSVPENKKKMLEAIEKLEKELGKEIPLIIGGKEVYKEEKLKSINPSNKDEVVCVFQKATSEDAQKALDSAWKAFEEWRFFPPEERANILLKAAEIARKRKFELSATMVMEVGKNWAEADADVAETIDYFEFYGREMLRYAEKQPLTPFPGEINEYFYIPLGVGVVIPPWNFPLAILSGMSSAAIVTGNCIILKPSSDSPLTGYRLVEIMKEAGLPDGVLNFLTGPGSSVGDYLVGHPKTRFIAFTGSKEVGCHIYELAAKVQEGQIWLKRVIAEMGGKDSIVVDDECILDDAVQGVLASAFGYQGQKCSACSRAIVHEKVYDEFVSKLKEKIEKIKIGPAKENHFMGPVINASAEKKILEYIEIGKKEGKLLTGGEKAEGNGFYIKPTTFYDVDPKARISQEEIFGPVLAIIKAKNFDHGIEIANNTIYGLTGSVYTLNREKIYKAKKLFHCGNLYINRKCTGALVDVHPFGGFNMSGTDSKAGGRDYLLLFLQGKSISEKIR